MLTTQTHFKMFMMISLLMDHYTPPTWLNYWTVAVENTKMTKEVEQLVQLAADSHEFVSLEVVIDTTQTQILEMDGTRTK